MKKYQVNHEPCFIGVKEVEAESVSDAALLDSDAGEVAWSEGSCEVYVRDVEANEVWLCEVHVEHVTTANEVKIIEVDNGDAPTL